MKKFLFDLFPLFLFFLAYRFTDIFVATALTAWLIWLAWSSVTDFPGVNRCSIKVTRFVKSPTIRTAWPMLVSVSASRRSNSICSSAICMIARPISRTCIKADMVGDDAVCLEAKALASTE